ncbi:uncharacterized protein [Halyomorpha halys]|uniref:uncharacterized protein n=1 Tax=Halyomorpha halys TaxID=286706 RepID=UPI0034D2F32D
MSTNNSRFSLSELSKSSSANYSLTGSYISNSEMNRKGKRNMINPKLLEMVIKTINKRPSIAAKFHEGLAKTATQTWNAHLAARKRMTRNQKVIEDMASSFGLAKGMYSS